MAIVKAYFTRSSEKIKKTLNYIVHRPGREGEKLNHELFGDMEESIEKDDAYRFIEARGMNVFSCQAQFSSGTGGHTKRPEFAGDYQTINCSTRGAIAAAYPLSCG